MNCSKLLRYSSTRSHRFVSHAGARSLCTVPAFVQPHELKILGGRIQPATSSQAEIAELASLDQILLDTRNTESYEEEHITDAAHIHEIFTYLLPKSDAEGLKGMQNLFIDLVGKNGITGASNEHVIIYEQGLHKMYGQSCRGFFILKYLGHPNVSVMQGGFDAFKMYCGPEASSFTTSGACDRPAAIYAANIDETWMCCKNQVMDVLDEMDRTADGPKRVFLDVRDKEEWYGTSSSPYGRDFCPRKGRIPNSKWIEWYDFMEPDDSYSGSAGDVVMRPKSKETVIEMLNQQCITKDDEIIVYCFKGARASNTLMVLRESGFKNVKNYFASWNEWSRDLDLPVDDAILKEL